MKFLQKVQSLSSRFTSFEIEHVSREQKFRPDLTFNLATSKTTGFSITVIQETSTSPSIKADMIYSLEVVPKSNWMSPILHYLLGNELALDVGEARKIQKHTAKYSILYRKVYKMGKVSPMLWFLGEHDTSMELEEIHKGACNNHIGREALAHELLRTDIISHNDEG